MRNTVWIMPIATAPFRSPSCTDRTYISVSKVEYAGPPNIRTAPNDVKQNKATAVLAKLSAGRMSGKVMVTKSKKKNKRGSEKLTLFGSDVPVLFLRKEDKQSKEKFRL